ncbi:hypothetical protein LT330_001689 [Penicillium expansum]|nr:hypothetical protein LT330_001689 [Penicillium expansum]
MITSIYASIFLATALALTGVQAASECWTNVHNSTISFSSRAAITFSYDIETATDCLNWCAPLSIAPNPGFTFGGCAPSHVDEYTLVHTPIPSSTAIASNTHGATSSTNDKFHFSPVETTERVITDMATIIERTMKA